jgi:hypothetical protein
MSRLLFLLLFFPLGQAPVVRPALPPPQAPVSAPAIVEQQVASTQITAADDAPLLVVDCQPAAPNIHQLVAECVERHIPASYQR